MCCCSFLFIHLISLLILVSLLFSLSLFLWLLIVLLILQIHIFTISPSFCPYFQIFLGVYYHAFKKYGRNIQVQKKIKCPTKLEIRYFFWSISKPSSSCIQSLVWYFSCIFWLTIKNTIHTVKCSLLMVHQIFDILLPDNVWKKSNRWV